MKEEAAMKGFYHSPNGQDYPRLQILTIEEILQGKGVKMPAFVAPITPPALRKKARPQSEKLL
jgi:hypothetical protein